MAKEITLTIAPNGDVQIETSGFTGSDCLKETLDLEQKFGLKTKDTKKREFSQTTVAAKQTARN